MFAKPITRFPYIEVLFQICYYYYSESIVRYAKDFVIIEVPV